MTGQTPSEAGLSILRGPPLSEEPGLGALTLPAYLREVTGRFAAREALVWYEEDGSVEHWSYAELHARALAVARALVACGVGKDSRVAILMTNRPEWLACFFGIGLAGGVAVPLSTFSTPAELHALVRASCASILLFEQNVLKKDFAAILHELEPRIASAEPGALASAAFPFLRRLAMVGQGPAGGAVESWPEFLAHGETIAPELVEASAACVKPADPGLIFFSSGSTGKPKGIVNAHRAVCIQMWRWRRMYGLEDDVRSLSANGFFWSGTFGQTLGSTFSSGGSVILLPTFDPERMLQLIEAERVTLPVAWPHQFAKLETAPGWATADLSSLKYIDPAMAAARHPTVTTRWHDPRAAYGSTETFTISTGFVYGSPEDLVGEGHGVPFPGNTIKIVDPLTGAILPRGQSGEIGVKGATLMLSYLGLPPDESFDDEGYYRTGDGGHIDQRGWLIWEGRLTDIIKTGGANVSPVEIDAELALFPGVHHCQTVGVPHETLGELVVGCVVPAPGERPDEEAMRDFLKARLASYKVPRRILLVGEHELSLTGSAKVRANALRELAAKRLAGESGVGV